VALPQRWSELTGYEFLELRHAGAIVSSDYPDVADELWEVLSPFAVSRRDVISGGGGKSVMTQWLERELNRRQWQKRNFNVRMVLDDETRDSKTHEVDHVRAFDDGRRAIALEIEWNNKDPFFDRDLQNFQRLHDLGVISAGIILTRGPDLNQALANAYFDHFEAKDPQEVEDLISRWPKASERQRLQAMPVEDASGWLANKAFQSKYGQATTHWAKLTARIERGLGEPCPLVLVGIQPERLVD
jgi:hypothetical protein